MVLHRHALGHIVTDDELVDLYLRATEVGTRYNIQIGYEVHIQMWSEDFRRVSKVGRLIMARGVPFKFIMDYSHCLCKIGNVEEQYMSGIREDVRLGRITIDPFEKGNLVDEWLNLNMVWWQQNRPAVPNNPKNMWFRDEAGKMGRGVQYPFLKPHHGEWYEEWQAYLLEPTKEVIRKTLRYHLTHDASPLELMTVDYINLPDYGQGVMYDMFENCIAVGRYIRETYAKTVDELAFEAARAKGIAPA